MLQNAFFIGLLILVTLGFGGLLSDFFLPIFWAATFAVIFHPLHLRLKEALKGRNTLAVSLTMLIIIAAVLVPAFLIASAVVREAAKLYTNIQSGQIDTAAPLAWIQAMMPQAFELAHKLGIDLSAIQHNLTTLAVYASQRLGSSAIYAGQEAVRFTAMFFLMLYLLFFFLRDGGRLLELIIHALPIGDERERQLLSKFAEVSRATVRGTLLVGVIQGTLGGLLFWLLGIDGAAFWGVLMMVLSLLPALGPALVWLPAAIILFASGAFLKAIILVVSGVFIIGLVDNLLRPILVGRDTKMPDYLVLLSTLGGLTAFGISGFVIGPVIAAMFLAVWTMFEAEHQQSRPG
ncbi:MAG: AI-2E family transporter [Gammaproteobacteria bacterium]